MIQKIRPLFKYLRINLKSVVIALIVLIVVSLLGILPASIIQHIFDDGASKGDIILVLQLVSLLIVVYTARSILNLFSCYTFTNLGQNVVESVTNELSTKILNLPMAFLKNNSSGYLTSRILESQNIGSFFSQQTFKVLISIFEFIGIFFILCNMNVTFTLILILFMPLFYLATKRLMKKVKTGSYITLEKNAKFQNRIQESMQGLEEIKSLNFQQEEKIEIEKQNKQLKIALIKQGIAYSFGMELLSYVNLFVSAIIYIIGCKFIIDGQLTLGQMIVFITQASKLYNPVQLFATTAVSIQPALSCLERINEFMIELDEKDTDVNKLNINSISSIVIKNLSFMYPESNKQIFNNFSLNIEASDKLMIKGKNGSGKTTFLRLILGLYKVDTGMIKINNIDINNIKRSDLRERIGIVSQKIFLLDAGVIENIVYGNKKYTLEKLKQILDITGTDKIQNELDKRNILTIGENGKNLSGGQIQRIAIARAILKDSDLYLFDEMSKNLDVEFKYITKKLIETQLQNKICIFVEHSDIFDHLCDKSVNI